MKRLITLILIAYGMSIIIETSSTYVPSTDKSKDSIKSTPSTTLLPPPVPQQQFEQDSGRDYVQGEVNSQSNRKDYERPVQNPEIIDDNDINDNQGNHQYNQYRPNRNEMNQNYDNRYNNQILRNKKRSFRQNDMPDDY